MEKTLLDIFIILIFTKVGGLISRKFKMPEVLGSLIAGVIIGPAVLNLVQYDNNIKLLSNLGVIMLMFLAGIETDIDKFKKAGFSSFIIACCGVIIPLILGTLNAFLFFHNFFENIFIGTILTATSVSITAETLTEMGKLNTKAGINILGAAVIDDILGLALISFIFALSKSQSSIAFIFPLIFKISLFCIISVLAIIFVPKIADKYSDYIKPSGTLITFIIAFGLIFAFFAERTGIAGITGAFMAGLAISAFPYKIYVKRNIKTISLSFLSPIFFASVGIEANFKGLNLETFLITLLMFFTAVMGKIIGCGGAARILKMGKRESLEIGAGMVSRGEVAIITANIGLQNHIISEEVFIPTLIVVILTTIITPVLLKLSFSNKTKIKS